MPSVIRLVLWIILAWGPSVHVRAWAGSQCGTAAEVHGSSEKFPGDLPRSLETEIAEAFRVEWKFRSFVYRATRVVGRLPDDSYKRVELYRQYVERSTPEPGFLSADYWAKKYFFHNPLGALLQYGRDLRANPWRLLFAPRRPGWTRWTLSAPALAVFLGGLSALGTYTRFRGNQIYEQKVVKAIYEYVDFTDLRERVLEGRVPLADAISSVEKRLRDLKPVNDFAHTQTRTPTWPLLAQTAYWQPMRTLWSMGFIKSAEDYQDLTQLHVEELVALKRMRADVAAGETGDLQMRQLAEGLNRDFLFRCAKRFGKNYDPLEIFTLSGFGTGVVSQDVVRVARLARSSDSVIRELVASLPASENTFLDLDRIEALAKFREEGTVTPNRIRRVLRFQILEELPVLPKQKIVQLEERLSDVFGAGTPEEYSMKSQSLVEDFEVGLDLPNELAGYVFDLLLPVRRLPDSFIYQDAKGAPPVSISTVEAAEALASFRFELAGYFTQVDEAGEATASSALIQQMKNISFLREQFPNDKSISHGSDLISFCEKHHLFGSIVQKAIPDQDKVAELRSAIALQIYFYRIRDIVGLPAGEWRKERDAKVGIVRQLQGFGFE